MGRAPCCDKNGLKKGPWTPEEDHKLISYIQMHGPGNWRTLPKNAGLQRCGKSCRLRWTNYLRPDIKRGRFSFEEEETIIQLHSILGNNSALCNPSSLLNLSNLMSTQALLNPDLLRLATTLSSLKQDNQELLLQQLQENQLYNSLLQSQVPFSSSQLSHQLQNLVQQVPASCTPTTTTGSAPFVTQPTSNTLPSSYIDTSLMSTSQPNFAYTNTINNPAVPELKDNTNFQSLVANNGHHSFGMDSSVLSTPLTSPAPLNSSSTFVNSSTEDERESYCSSLLKFEIPESLDLEDFM
ncbi:hypothetical protein Tsubulata_011606 [Turnera subulata]|uniref:Uncharacterized protein n=1 Tax=Turnera subulata TaxID=218843 RepID=A0A9Q0GGD0_9ROSI|nr:hypothetical protein Tsubulata_011606 [Turnera subulata]